MSASTAAQVALSPFNDEAADFVLQSSDGVAYHVWRAILGKGSSIFRYMLEDPQLPSRTAFSDHSTSSKRVVHVTEESKLLHALLQCLYPGARPDVGISDLVALYRAGDKYHAEAVKEHVFDKLSRYASLPAYCVRAYTIACYLNKEYIVDRAAVQAVYLPKSALSGLEYPELKLVPPSTHERLLQCRSRALSAVADMCTPLYWLSQALDTEVWAHHQLWDFYINDREKCNCECVDGILLVDEDGTMVDSEESAWDEIAYFVRKWCFDYFQEIESSIREERLALIEALRNTEALSRAMESAAACKTCRTGAIKVLLDLIKRISEDVDYEVKNVINDD
ncbi:hypothetical protein EIP86_005294 [Pleurotus ostreatoroseus]|nr:hypothetical protein EIP86_005294 [Pleurotus ostreatoroseus]